MINRRLYKPKIMSDVFSKNKIATCIKCGREDRIYAKGLCMSCYMNMSKEERKTYD